MLQYIFIPLFVILLASITLPAQNSGENPFLETAWEYRYSVHEKSNRVLEKSTDKTRYSIYFRYDKTWQSINQGRRSEGQWEYKPVRKNLRFNFKGEREFMLVHLDPYSMILQSVGVDSNVYTYHFTPINEQTILSNFDLATQQYPLLTIRDTLQNTPIRDYRFIRGVKGKRRLYNPKKQARIQARIERDKAKVKEQNALVKSHEFLKIELVGGGFRGGPNPIRRNFITIDTDGNIVKEYETKLEGLRISKFKIPRKRLEELIEYIEKKNFFDLQQIYACEGYCIQQVQRKKLRPIPLRLAVTRGRKRKLLVVNVWTGIGQHPMINYPKEIDAIIKAILDISTAPI